MGVKRPPVLLGMNALSRLPVNFSSQTSVDNSRSRVAKVTSRNGDPVLVPAQTAKFVSLSSNSSVSTVSVEPLNSFYTNSLLCMGGICAGDACLLRVFNFSNRDVWIPSGTPAALVRRFDPLEERVDIPDVEFCENGSVIEIRNIQAEIPSKFDVTEAMSGCDLEPEQLKSFHSLLKKYESVFCKDENDLGFCDLIQHRIPLKDDLPVKSAHRRLHPNDFPLVKKEIQKLLANNVIRPSVSPYASPVCVVKKRGSDGKPTGEIRLVVDYRLVNKKIEDSAVPIPNMEETLQMAAGAKFFSKIDLTSAYFQCALHHDSSQVTAFRPGTGGLFEFTRLPQGLKSSGAQFQTTMEKLFEHEIHLFLVIYLDDLLFFSQSFERHLEHLEIGLRKLQVAGFKAKLSKCQFFCKELSYLGHRISCKGIEADADKIKAISELPEPSSFSSLATQLGMFSFYRKFVRNFAQTAAPLNEALSHCPNRKPKSSKKQRSFPTPCVRLPFAEVWTSECRQAWLDLRSHLINSSILAFPNFEKVFYCQTDASLKGLGAVLSQVQEDGERKVVAFASRSLRPSEKNSSNYSSRKLELLALKWSICEKFRPYLQSSHCVVLTDSNPLRYLSTSKLSAVELRWVSQLASFSLDVRHVPAHSNVVADCLSRSALPYSSDDCHESDDELDEEHQVPSDLVDVLRKKLALQDFADEELKQSMNFVASSVPLPECLRMVALEKAVNVVDAHVCSAQFVDPPSESLISPLPQISLDKIKKEQKGDPRLKVFFDACDKSNSPFFLKDDVLFLRKGKDFNGEDNILLVVPFSLKQIVLQFLHDRAGHQGRDRTEALVSSRYYWPSWRKDVRKMVLDCERCRMAKIPPKHLRLVPGSLVVSQPNEVVAIDFSVLEKASNGMENVLVITDHFSKFSIAVATKDQTAATVAKVLVQKWFFVFSIPHRLHSDRGRSFNNKIIAELCKLFGLAQSFTSPYHPSGNGVCERFNRTLHTLLRTLPNDLKRKWPELLPELCYFYNSTPHSVNNLSPHFLMFGRQPVLPIQILLPSSPSSSTPPSDWVDLQRRRLEAAWSHSKRIQQSRSKANRDRKINKGAKPAHVLQGTRVFLKNRVLGRNKIQDMWDSTPYIVRAVVGDNTYRVIRADESGPLRTVRREDLLATHEMV